jgi:hypothetical protein
MFIVARRGTRLKRGFFIWCFVMFFGLLGLTMHVHYDPDETTPGP